MKPDETLIAYVRRMKSTVIAMFPHAKEHGLRYYFDTDFRRGISYRRRRKIKDKVRKARAGPFWNRTGKKRLKTQLIERDGQRCNGCKQLFNREELTIDHVLALFMGGNSDPANLQLLCEPCHVEKNRQETLQFYGKQQ
jgi:5-methylcytosine-specific restriction endonuclease McrA